jgi:hypothetical protein
MAPQARAIGRLRAVVLRLWLALLLSAGLLLLILTIAPNMTPARGVLNAYGRPVGLDFIAPYSAGRLLREGRPAAAYDDQAIAAAESAVAGTPIKGLRWPYPPGNLALAGALASLPYLAALIVWLGLSLLGLGVVVWRLSGRLAAALLLPLVPAVSYACMTGQTGVAAAALAGGGFLLLPLHPMVAGILLGLVTLKPQIALLLPVCLLAARETRALAWLLATAVLLSGLGLAFGGWATMAAFLASAGGMLSHVAATPDLVARMPTVFIGLLGAGCPAYLAAAGQALATAVAAILVYRVWRQSREPLPRILAWASAMPLAAPYVFDYDLAVLALPLACFAASPARAFGGIEIAVVTLLWALPVLISPVGQALGLQLGALAAAGLLAYAFGKAFAPPSVPPLGSPAGAT